MFISNDFLRKHENESFMNELLKKHDEMILSEMKELINKLEEKRKQLSKNVSKKDIQELFYNKYIIPEVFNFNDIMEELLEEEYKLMNNKISLTDFIEELYDGMYCIHEDKDHPNGYFRIYYAFESNNMEKIYAKKILYYLDICEIKNIRIRNEKEIRKNIKE